MLLKGTAIKDKEERLVTGWASVDVVDKDKEIVDIDDLEKKFLTLQDRGGILIDSHSNRPVGKILNFERKPKDVKGTPTPGLFVTVKVFDDYKSDDEVWEKIKSKEYTGFSFGGASHDKEFEPGSKGEVTRLKDLEAHELSVVEVPANQESLFEDINMLAKSGKKLYVVKATPEAMKELIGKPFAGYKDFADCESQNQDKDDPKAYCATIMREVEGKSAGVPKTDEERRQTHQERYGTDKLPPRGTGLKDYASSDVAGSADDYKIGDGAMSKTEEATKQDEEDKKPPFPPKPKEEEKKPEEKSSAAKQDDEEEKPKKPEEEKKEETTKSVEERMEDLEKKFDELAKQISTSEESGKTMQAGPEGSKVKLPKDPTTEDTPIGEGKDEAESSQAASEVMEKMEELKKDVSMLKKASEAVKKSSTPRPFEGETSLFAKEEAEDPAKAVIKAGKEGKLPTWKNIDDAVQKDTDAHRSAALGG